MARMLTAGRTLPGYRPSRSGAYPSGTGYPTDNRLKPSRWASASRGRPVVYS